MLTKSPGSKGHQPLPRKGCSGSQSFATYAPILVSPGGGHGNPPQYSCLENPMDRGAWRATVQRVAKSQTRLSKYYILDLRGSQNFRVESEYGFPGVKHSSYKWPGWGLTAQDPRHAEKFFETNSQVPESLNKASQAYPFASVFHSLAPSRSFLLACYYSLSGLNLKLPKRAPISSL